jgi:hypothetical protein
MNEFMWLDAPRVVGLLFALGTIGYIFVITARHHDEFWEGVKGEDGKLQFIEAALTIWLALFVPMAIADFAFGLVASDHLYYSMDSIFLIGVGGSVAKVMNRNKKEPPKDEVV